MEAHTARAHPRDNFGNGSVEKINKNEKEVVQPKDIKSLDLLKLRNKSEKVQEGLVGRSAMKISDSQKCRDLSQTNGKIPVCRSNKNQGLSEP